MDAKELKVNYDPSADVAYFSYGEPREALSFEGEGGIVIRFDPETNKVVGFTVVNFLRRFQKDPGAFISLPTSTTVSETNTRCSTL